MALKVGEAIKDLDILEEIPDVRLISLDEKLKLVELLKGFCKLYHLQRAGWSATEEDER